MKKLVNKKYVILLLLILFVALIYISDIENLPSNVILFEGESLSLNMIYGISIETTSSTNPNIEGINNNETITVSSDIDNAEADYTGEVKLDVKLLGLKVKEVTVNVIENTEVIPLGNLIGLKLYTHGVLVVGMSEVSGEKPYENSGIEEGDIIVEVNGEEVTETKELTNKINSANGEKMTITYLRERRNF